MRETAKLWRFSQYLVSDSYKIMWIGTEGHSYSSRRSKYWGGLLPAYLLPKILEQRSQPHMLLHFSPVKVLVFNSGHLCESARFIHSGCFPSDSLCIGIFRKQKSQACCWLVPLSLSLTAILKDLHFCLLWHEPSCLCISSFPTFNMHHGTLGWRQVCPTPCAMSERTSTLLHRCLDVRSPLHDGGSIPGSAGHGTRAHSHCRGQIRAQGTDFSLIRP